MTSIIVNTFYRALLKIEEEDGGFKAFNAKTLAVRLVDDLYPEDGYIALEDDPRGTLRVHLDEKFMDRIRVEIAKGLNIKEATNAVGFKPEAKQEATVPMATPPNRADTGGAAPREEEIKEVKVKETKPKLTKEQKEAEKAAKAKAAEDAKAAKAKAAEDAKAAKALAEVTDKLATMTVAPKKAAAKPKFVGNLEKMNPTHEKLWKKVAAEQNIELTDDHKKRFLTQINALDNTVYNAKKLEVHMTEFFKPKEPELKTEPMEMEPVDFKGKEYWVSADGRVWEDIPQEDGSIIQKKVGNVGMLAFSEMPMPMSTA